jgi:hypothetical protein
MASIQSDGSDPPLSRPDPHRVIERDCLICRKPTEHKMLAAQFVCTECFPELKAR